MKRVRSYFCLFWVLACCFSCSRDKTLDEVEFLLQDYPDSALSILQGMPGASVKGAAARARYALLYSAACDKNYIDISSDSTIVQAIKWYEKSSDKYHLMLSYYYAGRIQFNAGNFSEAVLYAAKAIELAESEEDYYYAGLINWLFGDVYYSQHNYFKARDYFSKADQLFVKARRVRYSLFSKSEMAKMDLAMREYHRNDSILASIYPLIEKDDDALLSTYYSLMLRSCSMQGKDREAISFFNKWNELPIKTDPFTVYGNIALSFLRTGDKQTAFEKMQLAYTHAISAQLPLASSFQAWLLYYQGNYKEAIDSLSKSFDYQNEVVYTQFANTVEAAFSEYYKSESVFKEQQMRRRIVDLAVLAGLLILGGVLLFFMKKKSYQRKLDAAKEDILFISQMNRENLKNFNKFLQIRQNMLDDMIAGYSDERYAHKSGAAYDVIDDKIESIKAGGDGFKKLTKDLNECFDDIVKKLKDHFPNITREEYRILVYYFSGFSQETVSTLTGVPVQKLYNLKRTWVERFSRLPSPDRELFLGRLNPAKMSNNKL